MSSVIVFSVLTSTMWVAVLVWAFRHSKQRWYDVWVLLLATAAWWLGECVAIRLGKYQYAAEFPGWLVLPFGGTPNPSEPLASALMALHAKVGLPRIEGCMPAQASWNVPFPIIALEGCLVFAFLRLSYRRLQNSGWVAAIAAGCFSAVLMVTLAGILDPVVSTTQWCGAELNNPHYGGLDSVRLWHWFTNEDYTGYWFGVPMVNYVSWFVGMWAFSFLARLDDDGPGGIIRHYDRWYKYVLASIATLVILFAIEFPMKIASDVLLVRGRQILFGHIPIPSKGVWEFGVLGGLMVSNLFVVFWLGRPHPGFPEVLWVAIVPPFAVLAFCLAYVLGGGQLALLVVWIVSAAMTVIVALLPPIVRYMQKKAAKPKPAEPAHV